MPTKTNVNCTTWPNLEADPDIAGVGVIIGFMLSAYSTLAIVIAHYLVNFENLQNPIDQACIKFVMPEAWIPDGKRHSEKWTKANSEKWNKAMEAAVITFSDTQVITGIAILLCGYIQLPSGISTYHWQVIIALAWFSSLTHLATLTSIRGYLRGHRGMAIWRSIFMGIVVVLLATALGPTGYVSQSSRNAMPAICMFSSKRRSEVTENPHSNPNDYFDSYNFPLVFLSIGFLVTIYIIKLIKLSLETWPRQSVTKIANLSGKGYEFANHRIGKTTFIPINVFWNMFKAFLLLVYTLSKAVYEISDSRLWQFFCLFVALAWGTLRLIGLRIEAGLDEESKWGFGQILPVLLSFLPIWSVYGTIYDEKHKKESKPAINASTSTSSLSNPGYDWSGLHLRETKWFPKLIILVFGLASVLAADILFHFPLGPVNPYGWGTDDLRDNRSFNYLLSSYGILLSVSVGILLAFTSTCLVFQSKKTHPPLGLVKYIQDILWICLILALVAGFFLFDWYYSFLLVHV